MILDKIIEKKIKLIDINSNTIIPNYTIEKNKDELIEYWNTEIKDEYFGDTLNEEQNKIYIYYKTNFKHYIDCGKIKTIRDTEIFVNKKIKTDKNYIKHIWNYEK